MDNLRSWMDTEGWQADVPPYTQLNSNGLPREGTHQVVWCGIPQVREYKDLIEDERARSGLEVDEILATVKDPHLLKSCVLKCVDDGDDEVYVRFNRWVFPDFQERLDDLQLGKDAIIVKGVKREGFGVSIQARELWAVSLGEDDE
jgi:DNA polymerase-3 subunit alpha